jgi:prepilin-type N-terminal cleavage/methylation domain-containing protein
MRSIHRHHQAGFTLVEVVVATTVFGVGVLGVVVSISFSTRASIGSLRQADAAKLARNQIELAVSESGDGLTQRSGESGLFHWRLSYESHSELLYLVRVNVNWSEQGTRQQLQLSRLFIPLEGQSEHDE